MKSEERILAMTANIERLYAKADAAETMLKETIIEAFGLPEDSIDISYLQGDGVAVMNPETNTGTPVADFLKQAKEPRFDITDFFTSL